MGTMVMNRLLPEGSVVGSFDSGVIGYFSRFPVMNLDGLANSWDHLRAMQAGTAYEFRQRHGLTHTANMRWISLRRDQMLLEGPYLYSKRSAVRRRPSHVKQFKLWVREPRAPWSKVDRATWFWERLEPHLELQADGVGYLVDGRLRQAFVRDCAPDELAVWSWGGSGERGGTVLVPWMQMAIGLCTSAIVLPHDAPPPVRVDVRTGTAG